jgi:hypothetical protein
VCPVDGDTDCDELPDIRVRPILHLRGQCDDDYSEHEQLGEEIDCYDGRLAGEAVGRLDHKERAWLNPPAFAMRHELAQGVIFEIQTLLSRQSKSGHSAVNVKPAVPERGIKLYVGLVPLHPG